MTQPESSAEKVLTDKDLVVFIFSRDITFLRKERKQGYKTLFFFDVANPKLQEVMKAWQKPATLPELSIEQWVAVARHLFSAQRVFNSAVHDDL